MFFTDYEIDTDLIPSAKFRKRTITVADAAQMLGFLSALRAEFLERRAPRSLVDTEDFQAHLGLQRIEVVMGELEVAIRNTRTHYDDDFGVIGMIA